MGRGSPLRCRPFLEAYHFMPKGKGKTFKFFGGDGEVYPFYAVDENKAIRYALDWSRRTGTKLYRRRPK